MLTQHLTNMLERVIIQLRHDDNIIQKYVPSLTYVLDILIFTHPKIMNLKKKLNSLYSIGFFAGRKTYIRYAFSSPDLFQFLFK